MSDGLRAGAKGASERRAQSGAKMNVGSTRILRAAALRTIRSVSLKWIGPSSVGWPSDHENTIRARSAPAAAVRGNCALQILVGEWAIESPKFMPMNCFG